MQTTDTEQKAAGFYAAFGEKLEWKSEDGEAMPQWNDLPERIKEAFAYAVNWLEPPENVLPPANTDQGA